MITNCYRLNQIEISRSRANNQKRFESGAEKNRAKNRRRKVNGGQGTGELDQILYYSILLPSQFFQLFNNTQNMTLDGPMTSFSLFIPILLNLFQIYLLEIKTASFFVRFPEPVTYVFSTADIDPEPVLLTRSSCFLHNKWIIIDLIDLCRRVDFFFRHV